MSEREAALTELIEYLASYGINAHDIPLGSTDRDGYDEVVRNRSGRVTFTSDGTDRAVTVRMAWPESFDYDAFMMLENRAWPIQGGVHA